MQFIAIQKNTRQTARKVRLVANQIKKLDLAKAIDALAVVERRASLVLLKTIKQAVANAINNHAAKFEELKIKEILVTKGPTYKRFRAVSRGRAHTIFKRSCHVRVVLEKKEVKKSVETQNLESKKTKTKNNNKKNKK